MKVTETSVPGVLVLEPKVFGDDRGFFMESFNQQAFNAAVGHEVSFVQDNHSRSGQGVLRGLHYQLPPHAQGKLVRVTHGSVFDVAVDMRRRSATFGTWFGLELSADNRRQLWLPPGMAHGFFVLSTSAEVQYKATAYYQPASERSLRWDDPLLGIRWPLTDSLAPILSTKDAAGSALADCPDSD